MVVWAHAPSKQIIENEVNYGKYMEFGKIPEKMRQIQNSSVQM